MHGQILLSAFTETNSILVDLTIAIHLPKKKHTHCNSVNGSNNYQEKEVLIDENSKKTTASHTTNSAYTNNIYTTVQARFKLKMNSGKTLD